MEDLKRAYRWLHYWLRDDLTVALGLVLVCFALYGLFMGFYANNVRYFLLCVPAALLIESARK